MQDTQYNNILELHHINSLKIAVAEYLAFLPNKHLIEQKLHLPTICCVQFHRNRALHNNTKNCNTICHGVFFYYSAQVRFITQYCYIIQNACHSIQLFVGKHLRKKERGKERIRVHENEALFMHCTKLLCYIFLNCMTMFFAKSNVCWLISAHEQEKI